MGKKTRKQIALEELDYLEEILRIDESMDFVEVVGGQGGDVSRYRVYFNSDDSVKYVCEK